MLIRYPTLNKPSWTPPAPIFGNMWSIFYAVMGYASYLVWRQGGLEAQKRPLTFYGLQLAFNLAWPITFFLRKKLGQGQIVNLSEPLPVVTATIKQACHVDIHRLCIHMSRSLCLKGCTTSWDFSDKTASARFQTTSCCICFAPASLGMVFYITSCVICCSYR